MQRPKTFSQTCWRECTTELVALYIACALGAAHWLSLHWSSAALVAPIVMAGVLAAIFVLVQTMWFVVVSLEKVGTSMGFRKTPLV